MLLRPYQERAVSEIRSALSRSRAVVLALQVGGGKTVISCDIIKRTLSRRLRSMFVVHRVELVEQARERLAKFGIKAGVIKAGYTEHRDRPVQVACIPTLIRREFPPADLVIMDETHHAVSASWMRVAKHYRDAGSWIIGITATPERLDGRGLGEIFDEIVEPVTTAELVKGGYLIDPVVYAPATPDLGGVRVRAGDYALPDLAERMNRLTGSVTEYWQRYGMGTPTLCFAVNVAHSRQIEEAFRALGARIMHVDGKSSRKDRERANRGLRDGSLDIVTQCALWTEGVDIPNLGCLVVARPTMSLSLHRQMIGRVMRTHPGKERAVVLDHAGNHHRHGPITMDVDWSLDAKKREARAAEPVRTCPECFAVLPVGAVRCAQCGAELPARDEAEAPGVENPGELVKYKGESLADRQRFYAGMVRTASVRGYTVGWARFRYRERYGTWPRLRMIEQANYTCPVPGHAFTVKTFGPRRVERCEHCYLERGLVRA